MLNIGNNLIKSSPEISKKGAKNPNFTGYTSAPNVQYQNISSGYPTNYTKELASHSKPYSYGYPNGHNYPITPNLPADYTKINTLKTPFGQDIHLYMLSNGQKIAIMPKTGTTIVKTFVNSGAMNETDEKRGISHFIEHNLFNGSEKLEPGQLFKEVSNMGAQTNASTNFAQTDYFISSAMMEGTDLAKTVEMQADMVLRPKFLEEMIEKEKGPVTSEISMVNDDIATIAVNKIIKNLFQINSNADNLVAGSIQTVNSITRDNVVDYWKRHYTPDNLTTVIVGEVDPDSAIQLIAKNFNGTPVQNASALRIAEKLIPTGQPARVDYISPKDNSALVMGAFAGPVASSTRENIAMNALALLLLNGSNARLSKNLRQINAYGYADMEKVGLRDYDPRVVSFSIQTPPNKEQTGLDMLYSAIQDVKINPPTNEEMIIIKNALNKALSSGYESSEAICDMIGTSIIEGDINAIGQYQNIINSLTPADLVEITRKYLDLNKISIGVVHPNGTTAAEISQNYNTGKFSQKKPVSFGSRVAADVSFTGKTLNTNDIKELKLADNSYLAINDSPSDIAYFNWKLTSYSSAPKNPAAPYVLTEILNSGSIKRDKTQFTRDSELKGIDFNFDSNSFSITANANCLANNSLETISMLKEVILNPRFGHQEFEIAKQKIHNYCSSLGKSASESLIAQLYPEFFPTSASIVEGLKTLTLKDVRDYYNHLINNASSNFVATAPVSKNQGLENALVEKICANRHVYKNQETKLNQIYQPTGASKVLVQTEERNQAQVYKTYSFKMSGNIEDEVKFELLNTILGGSPSSRLFQDLREKQKLAYRVNSQVQSFADTGIITFFISTTTDDKMQNEINYGNLQKSLEGFNHHVQLLKNQPVGEIELENAKKILKQNIFKEMELPESETLLLAMNAGQPYGIKRIDEYFKLIDKITIADIQQAANHVFINRPIYSILASEDTIKNQTPYLSALGSVEKVG